MSLEPEGREVPIDERLARIICRHSGESLHNDPDGKRNIGALSFRPPDGRDHFPVRDPNTDDLTGEVREVPWHFNWRYHLKTANMILRDFEVTPK